MAMNGWRSYSEVRRHKDTRAPKSPKISKARRVSTKDKVRSLRFKRLL